MPKSAAPSVHINGGHSEGGGALLRTALVLSALTQQSVHIQNVRGGMRKKGLTAEDLCFIDILQLSCLAHVEGDNLGSETISFAPTRASRGISGSFDMGKFHEGRVPGGALIVLGGIAPLLATGGTYSSLIVKGETHANNALSFSAFERSTAAAWRQQGLHVFPSLVSTGFGSGARGEVHIDIEPSAFEPVDWANRGSLERWGCVITTTNMSKEAVERTKAQVTNRWNALEMSPEICVEEVNGHESGLGLTVWGEFENGFGSASAVLQRGGSLAGVVERVSQEFQEFLDSGAALDLFLADQVLLPAILATGKSVMTISKVTRRLISMIYVIKLFLPIKVTLIGHEGEPGTITVDRS